MSWLSGDPALQLWLLVSVVVIFVLAFFVLFAANRFSVAATRDSKVYLILRGWLIIIPFYLIAVLMPLTIAAALVVGILWLAISEVTSYAKLPLPYRNLLYVLAFITVVTAGWMPEQYLALPLLYFLLLSVVPVQLNDADTGLRYLSLSLFIAIWLIFFGGHIILLGHLDTSLGLGRALVGGIVLAVSLSDVGAFVFGKLTKNFSFARRTLIAPNITPNKHYVGMLGHIGGALAGLAIVSPFLLPLFSWFDLIVLASCIGVFGLFGGIAHSLVKRTFARKDSGDLIPGHGGVLDRIDSLVRAVGVVYYVVLVLL